MVTQTSIENSDIVMMQTERRSKRKAGGQTSENNDLVEGHTDSSSVNGIKKICTNPEENGRDTTSTTTSSAIQDISKDGVTSTSKNGSVVTSSPKKPVTMNVDKTVNIAVASRALFTMDREHAIYEGGGIDEYIRVQIQEENIPLEPGTAFPFVQAMNYVNSCLLELDENEEELFNVILMSHCHAQAGVRVIKSINHYNLDIQRLCLTGGSNPVNYLHPYKVKLFLTSYPDEVEQALEKGFAAAAMLSQKIENPIKHQLRIAFDLDAVLFSDASERYSRTHGMEAFFQYEQENADKPCDEGPLKHFAQAVGRMQTKFRENRERFAENPIRTYIVTARSAAKVGERAVKTLRAWGLQVDELHFLSGAPKGPILQAIKPHIFFDDSQSHIESAQAHGTPAAHVIHGITNQNNSNSNSNSNSGEGGKYTVSGSVCQDKVKVNLERKMSFFEGKCETTQ